MPLSLNITLIVVFLMLSGLFATLTYSLRDFSRARLTDTLHRRGLDAWIGRTIDHSNELAFLTATLRLVCNFTVLLCTLDLLRAYGNPRWVEYVVGAGGTAVLTTVTSVTIPHALALHVGEPVIGLFVRPLHVLRVIFRPLTAVLNVTENVVKRAATATDTGGTVKTEDVQSEILAVVQEGEKEGFVDEAERKMIQSVIQFGDATVGPVMTPRSAVIALPASASLERVRQTIVDSGHSRVPLFDGSLDQVVGVLYARDLIKLVGQPEENFNARAAARAAFFIPDTKPLQDLLADFRLQKVHIAIVLDEYGGTAGLITIEDVLEELVGDISDEHEPAAPPAAFRRIDDSSAEVDATIGLEEFNRLFGSNLPEDAGYETLGGFVSTHLGIIPTKGTEFEHEGVTFTVIEAEPQRVKRVKAQTKVE